MSFPAGPTGSGSESSLDEDAPADIADERGFFAALKRFSKRWSRRYVEMRVDARGGRRE